MLGILFKGEGQLEISDVPEPDIGVGDVKVASGMSGICGTDLHTFGRPGKPGLSPPPPVPSGHEICGTVQAVGAGVTSVSVGDRIVANHIVGCGACSYCLRGAPHFCGQRRRAGAEISGSLGQFVVVPERNVFSLPADLGFAEGVLLACNFGTAYSALRRARVSGADAVAVFGLGPVGQCLIMAAQGLGARVIGIEPNAQRRGFAAQTFDCEVIDPASSDPVEAVMLLTDGRGADVSVDASGAEVAQKQALDATRPLGTMIFIGVGGDTTISPFRQLIAKDLTVFGSYTYKLGEFSEMVRLVHDHNLPLGRLVSDVFSPQEAERAFAAASAGDSGKVLFDWSGVNP